MRLHTCSIKRGLMKFNWKKPATQKLVVPAVIGLAVIVVEIITFQVLLPLADTTTTFTPSPSTKPVPVSGTKPTPSPSAGGTTTTNPDGLVTLTVFALRGPNPLSGATINVSGPTVTSGTTTGADGKIVFSVKKGTYTIGGSMCAFNPPAAQTITINTNTTV